MHAAWFTRSVPVWLQPLQSAPGEASSRGFALKQHLRRPQGPGSGGQQRGLWGEAPFPPPRCCFRHIRLFGHLQHGSGTPTDIMEGSGTCYHSSGHLGRQQGLGSDGQQRAATLHQGIVVLHTSRQGRPCSEANGWSGLRRMLRDPS